MDTSFATEGDAHSWLLRLCTILSYTVVINTFYYKVPQIYAIIDSRSSAGISLTSVILEWIGLSIMVSYHCAMKFPLETYLELILTVVQDCLLLLVILANRSMINKNIIPYIFSYIVGFAAISLNWLSDSLMTIAIGVSTPILCWSKVDQLVEILWSQDPGSLSALSWFITLYDTGGHSICNRGNQVRILTTMVITKDMPMLINLTCSEVLNIAVFLSILYYNYKKKTQRECKPVELTE